MLEKIISLFGMIVSVFIICFLAYWVTKKLGVSKLGGFKMQSSNMKIYDRLMLAPNKMLAIVRVGERWLLIGVSDSQISNITEFTQDEVLPWLEKEENEAQTPAFSDIIKQAMQNRNNKS